MAASDAVRSEIAALNTRFAQAVRDGDAATLAGLYTSDAKVMPPGGPAVVGPEAIVAFWVGGPRVEISLATVELEVIGDTAIETGQATITAPGPERRQLDASKYVVVWKRVDGDWRVHIDIFNSDLSPPA